MDAEHFPYGIALALIICLIAPGIEAQKASEGRENRVKVAFWGLIWFLFVGLVGYLGF